MNKKNFKFYDAVPYALVLVTMVVLVVLAFLVYQMGNLEARILAVEYRQQLQHNFDTSNILRGALRSKLDDFVIEHTIPQQ